MDATEAPIYHAIIFCTCVIFFFIAVFVFSSVWQQRKFRNTTQLALKAEVATIERERSRISADLHDEAGPLIYGVLKRMEMLEAGIGEAPLLLADNKRELRELHEKLSEISQDLVPLSLTKEGLLYCIGEMIMAVQSMNPLQVSWQCNGVPEMTREEETHVFRILQEIVFNTLKHAGASKLIIEMQSLHQIIHIRTADNGKGMQSTPAITKRSGAGVLNIQNRAKFLNGSAYMRCVSGCQWDVRVEVGGSKE